MRIKKYNDEVIQDCSSGYFLQSKKLRNLILWVMALNLNIIFFYSGSVLFSIFPSDHQTAFAGLCLFNFFLAFMLFDDKFNFFIVEPKFIFVMLSFSLMATFVVNGNLTVVREFLVLLTVMQLVAILKYNYLPALLKRIAVINLLLMLASIAILFLVLTGLIDYKAWDVLKLDYISSNNPLYVKATCCDRDLYNPWYLLLLSETSDLGVGLGEGSERMMFIWNEPTGTPLYTIPLLLYLASVTNAIKRLLLLGFSVVILFLSYSMTGLLAFLAVAILYVLVRTLGARKAVFWAAIFTIPLIINIEVVLDALGGNKLDQYSYLSERINLKSQFTLFGLPVWDEASRIGYGTSFVYVRYGVFGYAIYLTVYLYIFFKALARLEDKHTLISNSRLIDLSILFAAIMSLRSNQLILPLLLMLHFSYYFLIAKWCKVNPNTNKNRVVV